MVACHYCGRVSLLWSRVTTVVPPPKLPTSVILTHRHTFKILMYWHIEGDSSSSSPPHRQRASCPVQLVPRRFSLCWPQRLQPWLDTWVCIMRERTQRFEGFNLQKCTTHASYKALRNRHTERFAPLSLDKKGAVSHHFGCVCSLRWFFLHQP